MNSTCSSVNKYLKFKRIILSKDILRNDAAIYSSSFGAIAEFADNAKDANAKSFKIFTIPTSDYLVKYGLCFLDDGDGMSPTQLEDAICYGKSIKRSEDKIGQFGVGLKSASMRLASNMILFTKCRINDETINSILLLSETFNCEIDEREPLVAMPSFKENCSTPHYSSKQAEDRFKDEMDLIFKYSPFKSFNKLREQFQLITSASGTLIICYDLKFSNSTQEELLKIDQNKHDILVNDYSCSYEDTLKFELESLRAYMSILYYRPSMKIYIFNKKVKAKLMAQSLAYTKRVEYEFSGLNDLKLKELKKAEIELKRAKEDLSSIENEQTKCVHKIILHQKIKKEVDKAKNDLNEKQKRLETAKKELKKDIKVDLVYGLNVENRFSDGFFIYYNNRLIMMHQKPSKKNHYDGICGVVNMPYKSLEINKSKQGFAEDSEYKKLFKVLCDHYMSYETKVKSEISEDYDPVDKFWTLCGYSMEDYLSGSKFLPQNEIILNGNTFSTRDFRLKKTNIYFQCDSCLKWRHQAWKKDKFNDSNYPSDEWTCNENQNSDAILRNNCSLSEALKSIPILRDSRPHSLTQVQTLVTKPSQPTTVLPAEPLNKDKPREISYSPFDKNIKLSKPLQVKKLNPNKKSSHEITKKVSNESSPVKQVSNGSNPTTSRMANLNENARNAYRLSEDSSFSSIRSRSSSPERMATRFSKRTAISAEAENVEPNRKKIKQNININNNSASDEPSVSRILSYHYRKLLTQMADLHDTLVKSEKNKKLAKLKNLNDHELSQYNFETLFDETLHRWHKNSINEGRSQVLKSTMKVARNHFKDESLITAFETELISKVNEDYPS